MKSGTLDRQWLDYSMRVIPESASDVQRKETRRAFYAGAQAMFALIDGASVAAGDDLDAGAAVIQGFYAELAVFCEAVKAGGA